MIIDSFKYFFNIIHIYLCKIYFHSSKIYHFTEAYYELNINSLLKIKLIIVYENTRKNNNFFHTSKPYIFTEI